MALKRAGRVVRACVMCAALPALLAAQARAGADSGRGGAPGMVPPGFGSLHLDDLAVVVQAQGLTARAVPLDEGVIRTLAPDTYRSLHAARESRAAQIEAIRTRLGLSSVQAWQVSFFNQAQGEARYDPRGMQLRSAGRDYRPLDVLALLPGFDDGRLPQGRTMQAIFVFDGAVALGQPVDVTLAGAQSGFWNDDLLQRLDRERSAIWSRAGASRKPHDRGPR